MSALKYATVPARSGDATQTEEADVLILSEWAGEPLLWHNHITDYSEIAEHRLRGKAIHAARVDHAAGLPVPSRSWRREYGVSLGLARMTADDPVILADGTQLAEHQVEVLEALLAAETSRIEQVPDAERPAPTAADPAKDRRYWLEHATGAGKTVVACALVDASRTGGVLILTHRNVLVDQFQRELTQRGYGDRLLALDSPFLETLPNPVVVTTYQQWARSWDQYDPEIWSLVICDEVHQSLGYKTSNAIRAFEDVIVVGMTATGKLLDKDVSELFPRQVSRFDLQQAAKAGVISPLRCLRVPPALGMQTLENVRMRGGDFDQDELAEALDRDPINYTVARLYKDLFGTRSAVVYAAGVRHAERLATAFVAAGIPAAAVSGETPRRELDRVLEDYENGKLRVITNAQLLTEGWNSPRAEVCLQLAPTSSQRIYQQRVGRVTRLAERKPAGIVVDFVDPTYRNDGKVITLHSLLNLDLYEAGAAVTTGPDPRVAEPDPPVRWEPHAVVPCSATELGRADALRRAGRQVSLNLLSDDDRLHWAIAAGQQATTPQQIKTFIDKLGGDIHLIVALLGSAARHTTRNDVMQTALDRLAAMAADHQDGAWQQLADIAEKTDNAQLHRRIAQRAVSLAAEGAADGVPGAHSTLLRLAHIDRPVYERVARQSRLGKKMLSGRPLPEDTSSVDELCVRALMQPEEEAVAIFAALPTKTSRTEAAVLEATQQLFPAPTDLARALQKAPMWRPPRT